ncbi:GATA transcription factor 21 isoform X2 [Ziziphus jujuba]|uniref:GATA transcription factor 21 isoform X2 n=1 Tax=Ziziphus jujuba TaxID=326968 RepID=A0ABM3IS70_ZIZJJ|nr:GATA transcription factor 21 isoform X2 [Ziziphus jujuba]
MAPTYHNLPPSPLHEDDHHHHHLFHLQLAQSSSCNLSLSSPFFTNPRPHHQPEFCYTESQPFQLHDQLEYPEAESQESHKNIWKNNDDIANENESEMNSNSAKWMPSEMRMIRKTMNNNPNHASTDSPLDITLKVNDDDHKKHPLSPIGTESSCNIYSSNNYNGNTIRVCADCNTTKTPLWRSGPRGPKSLCNACGIRQRKARRAMAAAAAAANGTVVSVEKAACMKSISKRSGQNKVKADKKSRNMGCAPPQFKKRCKQILSNCPVPNNKLGRNKKKLCFEDLAISISQNSAFQRVFPQDEKEAAILLMALSYGLVHG